MLGKQAEFCFEFYLKEHPDYKLNSANLQIQGVTETIGELDYIVTNCITNECIHVELACKFYLFDPALAESNKDDSVVPIASAWIGPNRKDTLSEKLTKLSEKQFPLVFKKETMVVLEKINITAAQLVQQLCLKAFLFIPKQHTTHQFPKPFQKNIAGYYLSKTEFLVDSTSEAIYAIPEKKEWLLPVTDLRSWHSHSEAILLIEEQLTKHKSPLIYKKSGATIEKIFVVWWK